VNVFSIIICDDKILEYKNNNKLNILIKKNKKSSVRQRRMPLEKTTGVTELASAKGGCLSHPARDASSVTKKGLS
jgi:hypothetical protein